MNCCCKKHYIESLTSTTTTTTRTTTIPQLIAPTPPLPRPIPTTTTTCSNYYEPALQNVVHENVFCNKCGMQPLRGLRFKSTVRDNVDLCVECFVSPGSCNGYSPTDKMMVITRSCGNEIYEMIGYARSSDVQSDDSDLYRVRSPSPLPPPPPPPARPRRVSVDYDVYEQQKTVQCCPKSRFSCNTCGRCLINDRLRQSNSLIRSPILNQHFDDLTFGVHQMASDPLCRRISIDTFKFRHPDPDPFRFSDDPFFRQCSRRNSGVFQSDFFENSMRNDWFDFDCPRWSMLRFECPLCNDTRACRQISRACPF